MAAQIPESDQTKQFKEFLFNYNKLTEISLLDCVKDFTTTEVKPEETTSLAAKGGLLGQPQ
ncbi:mitochondrial import inner membrane translocase subunit Tim9-like isoform X3 [Trichechus manatus latirostris]|uniref:Mitochondrial import inner membrane translocase subunit Tim9-like isoform X3 n=1 Tax=Trichechus manatus latirostris TaxID=127582 RepID=A0A2Y9FWL4_TRIMA|nr:mitochondrial import inner membrane translocase subunit Tim9-like isoform X3 [Trichechus manatus latirostris]